MSIWLQRILRPVSGLGDMTGYSQATAWQPYLIKKKKKKKKWSIVRQALHHVGPRVSHLTNDNYCVNAAPCRMLAWGKSLLNVKSCVSPTGPDHSKNRETLLGSLSPDRTRGQGGDRNDYQMSLVWHTTACRVQTKPVWELRKPWGLDPR